MQEPQPQIHPEEAHEDYVVPAYFEELGRIKVETIPARTEPIPRDEKRRLELRNRQLLEADLWSGNLVFASRPRVVELQLTNFCNMSCTMCYDGDNPPMKLLPEPLVDSLAEQLFPWASVFVPFATSEPLIITWDHTRKLAEIYGVELEITTNVQFLDEEKFAELEPHVGVIEFSIDSHIKDVYEAIRLRSRSDKVFRNLPVAAGLCREHGIEVLANVVFMMQNAPDMAETVAFLADAGIPTIHIQKLFHNKPEAYFDDAALHLSRPWIDRMKARIREVAREKQIRVLFDFDGNEVVDHLPAGTRFRETRVKDHWLERLRRYYPGYCPQSVYRFKVDADGNAYPCCVGTGDRLKLGNIYEDTFEELWNGPTQQDLRRGMLTGDVPSPCESCNFRTGPILGEVVQYPFNDDYHLDLEQLPDQRTIDLLGPDPLTRCAEPPLFRWSEPDVRVDRFELVLSYGGEKVDRIYHLDPKATEFRLPDEDWDGLMPNIGIWWTIYAIRNRKLKHCRRARTVRVLTRHVPIPRVEGSTLDYSRPA